MIISGYDRLDDCLEALEIGIEEIILKPVEPSELLNLLESSADRH